jgi:hypothetical protein
MLVEQVDMLIRIEKELNPQCVTPNAPLEQRVFFSFFDCTPKKRNISQLLLLLCAALDASLVWLDIDSSARCLHCCGIIALPSSAMCMYVWRLFG